MPITPRFRLSQTETTLHIDVFVPHVRVSVDSTEILIHDNTLHFASPPYLLVLAFPAAVVDDDHDDDDDNGSQTAKYDPIREGGMIMIQIKKVEAAFWPNLDMIANLIQPKTNAEVRKPLRVSIISETTTENHSDEEDDEEEEGWGTGNQKKSSVDQHLLFHDDESEVTNNTNADDEAHYRYGFANMFSGIFSDLTREGLTAEMLQLPNPDQTKSSDRRKLRLETEQASFDKDRYLGDLRIEDDYVYICATTNNGYHWMLAPVPSPPTTKMRTTSPPTTLVEEVTEDLSSITISASNKSQQHETFFTVEENTLLASIPYPILDSLVLLRDSTTLLLPLLDILFAYVYDHLTTQGDPTVESSWTISVLSATLSWLDTDYESISDVVATSLRRSLIYPYLRNYSFSLYCWDQVESIIAKGLRCIIRCLLQARSILERSEFHYLGNKLFLDPYLAWLQRFCTDDDIRAFTKETSDCLTVWKTKGVDITAEEIWLDITES